MRERLPREHPDVVPDLHRRASHWLEEQGLLTEAVDHALAARLIERVSPTLLWQRGELATLLRWLDHLPREVVRAHPRLLKHIYRKLDAHSRLQAVERARALGPL